MKKLALTLLVFCWMGLGPLWAADYFWVGGSGNWSDLSRWATTSGGTVKHLQYPTPTDRVFFDANSFTAPGQVVTLNLSNATCGDMDWNGAVFSPKFVSAPGSSLSLYGSLRLNASMDFAYQGTLNFEATDLGNTIDTKGITLNATLLLRGGGQWTLLSPLTTAQEINLRQGEFRTAGLALGCGRFNSQGTQTRSLVLGSSVVTVGQSWTVAQAGMSLDAATAQIIFPGGGSFAGGGMSYNLLRFGGAGSITNNNQFQSVQFLSSGRVSGDNHFQNLALTAGGVYTFGVGSTQYLDGSLTAIGTCGRPIIFESSTEGTQARLSRTSGTLTVERVWFYDIAAIGGASFVANESLNITNTTGWTIVPPSLTDLYWVGGSGNWSDPAHWSTSSGGPGGACVPSPSTNVYFDANSFSGPSQMVTVDLEIASCKNMDWTGAASSPMLMGLAGGDRLRIYGSLRFIAAMDLQYAGKVEFRAEDARTITSAGQVFKNEVRFRGQGGWTLLDNFSTGFNQNINYEKGSLTTNSHRVTCKEFKTTSGEARVLSLGASTIQCNYTWTANATNLTLMAGTSHIILLTSNAYMTPGQGLTYHNVTFDSDMGNSTLYEGNCQFNKMVFKCTAAITESQRYDTLVLAPGKEYTFTQGKTQTIGRLLQATGNCDLNIRMKSSATGQAAFFSKASGLVEVDYVEMQDIHASGGATFNATHCLDNGNNLGWNIWPLLGRTLYWVGGSGYWTNSARWSLSSGGPGGECPPNSQDDVIFDQNSFTAAGQSVNLPFETCYCHDMRWLAPLHQPSITGGLNLEIHGSLRLDKGMAWSSSATVHMKAQDAGNTLRCDSVTINGSLRFDGTGGQWTLLDPLFARDITVQNGSFLGQGHDINAASFGTTLNGTKSVSLGQADVFLSGASNAWNVYTGTTTLDAAQASIFFSDPAARMFNYGGFDAIFRKVAFEAETGSVTLENSFTPARIGHASFGAGARIYGENTFDSLYFSPNGVYQLDHQRDQVVLDHWQVRGNNCFPIALRSTQAGDRARVFKYAGDVSGDFIVMQDIEALGGAGFYAGNFSTDDGNNLGWVFDNQPGYVYGIGPDSIALLGQTVVLHTDNFNGDENTSYLWSTGATSDTLAVSAALRATVTANYSSSTSFVCEMTDTISVHFAEIRQPRCGGTPDGMIRLHTDTGHPFQVEWSTGQVGDSIHGLGPGDYAVVVRDQVSGETSTATFTLRQPDPLVFGLAVSAGCPGQGNSLLDATASGGTGELQYWLNGIAQGTTSVFNGLPPGTYPLAVQDQNGCRLDTTVVLAPATEVQIAAVAAVDDCGQGGRLRVSASGGSAPLEYSLDGINFQTDSIFEGLAAGSYTVRVRDALRCAVVSQGPMSIGNSADIQLVALAVAHPCEGQDDGQVSLQASGGTGGLSYSLDGLNFQSSGLFQALGEMPLRLTIRDASGCYIALDSSIVAFPAPQVDLGPDRVLTLGQSITLDAGSFAGVSYLWQPGGQTSRLISVSQGGTYSVVVTDNLSGCVGVDTLSIQISCEQNFDLRNWSKTGESGSGAWNVGPGGTLVEQVQVGRMSFFVSNTNHSNVKIQGQLQVNEGADDDFVGWVIGYQAPNSGTATDVYDTYLIDWKGGQELLNGYVAPEGFSLIRINGTLNVNDRHQTFWGHNDLGAFDVLETRQGAGMGWNNFQTYGIELQYTPTRLLFLVDGDTIFNREGCYQDGKFGLYTFTQTNAIFSGYSHDLQAGFVSQADGCGTAAEFSSLLAGCEASAGGIDTWAWDFGDGQTGTGANPSHDYGAPGTYRVNLSVSTPAGCSSLASQLIEVGGASLNLGADTSLCAGESLALAPAGSFDSYLWSDGSTGNSLTISAAGTYWLRATQGGCAISDTVRVSLRPLPALDLGPDQQILAGQSATLGLPAQSGWSYRWEPGGETSAQIAADEPGQYVLFFQSEANGCWNSDTLLLENLPDPCSSPLLFQGWQNEALGYGTWATSPGLDSTLQLGVTRMSFRVGPDSLANVSYHGKMKIDDRLTSGIVGLVFGYLAPDLPGNEVYDTYLFDWRSSAATNQDGQVSPEGWHLSRLNGSIPDAVRGSTFWSHAGNSEFVVLDKRTGTGTGWQRGREYDLRLDYSNSRSNLLIDGDTVFSIEGCFPAARFGFYSYVQDSLRFYDFETRFKLDFKTGNQDNCGGLELDFTSIDSTCWQGPLDVADWQWDFGDGQTSSLANPTHRYAAPGRYLVKLKAERADGCQDSSWRWIKVFEPPQIELADLEICPGDTVALDPGPFASYLWSDGSTARIFQASSSRDLALRVTDANGCWATDTLSINYKATGFGSKEANTWYFGREAGIDFNSRPPRPLTDGRLNTLEGTVTMSDANGNLLFYSDGQTVWNRMHQPMRNGTGLLGDSSSTQVGVIVPMPETPGRFYIFHMDAQPFFSPLYYSVIDFASDPLGEVVLKNQSLGFISAEKVTAVQHANGQDVWVIAHEWNTNVFKVFHLSASGLSPALNSAVGSVHQGGSAYGYNAIGHLKVSPQGDRIASAIFFDPGLVELFDFDKATGVVSNPIRLGDFPVYAAAAGGPYGIEFSPQSERLYVSVFGGSLWQYDLSQPDSASLRDTRVELANAGSELFGAVQLGPDGRVYLSRAGQLHLGVVNQPGLPGAASQFVLNGFHLGGRRATAGLPNLYQTYFRDASFIQADMACVGQPLPFAISDTSFALGALWDFDDPASPQNTATGFQASHAFSQAGTFVVRAELAYVCFTDTLRDSIFIPEPPVVDLGNDTTFCGSFAFRLDAGPGFDAYAWNLPDSIGQRLTASTLGDFWVEVTDSLGCTARDTLHIDAGSPPAIDLGADRLICAGNSATLAPLSGSFDAFLWSDGSSDPSLVVQAAGDYWLTVADSVGCQNTDTIRVETLPVPVFSLGNDTAICQGETIELQGPGGWTSYLWQDGQSGNSLTASTEGWFWLEAANALGCASRDSVFVGLMALPAEVDLGKDTSLCEGQSLTLQTASGDNLIWSDGSNETNLHVSQSGTYWARRSNACGVRADTVEVEFLPVPVFSLGNDTAICQGETIELQGPGGWTSYLWQDGQSGNSLTASTEGWFWLEAANALGCASRDSVFVGLRPLPQVELGPDQGICENLPIGLTLRAPGFSEYRWQDGSNADSLQVSEVGIYRVWVRDAWGCENTDSLEVFRLGLPNPDLGDDKVFCEGDTVLLWPGDFEEYLWQDGSTSHQINVWQSGEYWVEVGGANGCRQSDTVQVEVLAQPTLERWEIQPWYCEASPGSLLLVGDTSVVSYSIEGGENPQEEGLFVGLDAGWYTLRLLNSLGCAWDSLVAIEAQASMELLGTEAHGPLCWGDANGWLRLSLRIEPSANPVKVLWSNGEEGVEIQNLAAGWHHWYALDAKGCVQSDSILLQQPDPLELLVEISQPDCEDLSGGAVELAAQGGTGRYDFALFDQQGLERGFFGLSEGPYLAQVLDANGCLATDSVYLLASDCVSVLEIPNVFSPNGDNINDELFLHHRNIVQFWGKIYTRWGDLVYEFPSLEAHWDGTDQNSGRPMSNGVYFYTLEGLGADGQLHKRSGTINLYR